MTQQTLQQMKNTRETLIDEMAELMQDGYEMTSAGECTMALEASMETLDQIITDLEDDIIQLDQDLDDACDLDTSIDEVALAEYMAINDDAPEGDDPHGRFTGMEQASLFTVTLVSVEDPDDTRTEQVVARDRAHALELAYGSAPHWYTDIVSVKEQSDTKSA